MRENRTSGTVAGAPGNRSPYAGAVSAALFAMVPTGNAGAAPMVKSVEFLGMPAPSSVEERADIYTNAKMKVEYINGKSRIFDLQYHALMNTTDLVSGNVVGGFSTTTMPRSPTILVKWPLMRRTATR